MTIITDYADPCAVPAADPRSLLRAARGPPRRNSIEFDAGKRCEAHESSTGEGDLGALRAELSPSRSSLPRRNLGLRRRFGLRAGGY